MDFLPEYDAVILAGGRARRLGGLDKPGAVVGGLPLIERVAAAVAGARTLVVVGPDRGGLDGVHRRGVDRQRRVVFTREDPPGAGPVPALRAGLAEVTAEWVVLLAADLPFLTSAHVSALLRVTSKSGSEGAVLVDDDGVAQWLIGGWRTSTLTVAQRAYGGGSLRGLLGPLEPVRVHLPAAEDGRAPWFDCDTMDDLGMAREREQTREGEDRR